VSISLPLSSGSFIATTPRTFAHAGTTKRHRRISDGAALEPRTREELWLVKQFQEPADKTVAMTTDDDWVKWVKFLQTN
jgi:hypothetical protein